MQEPDHRAFYVFIKNFFKWIKNLIGQWREERRGVMYECQLVFWWAISSRWKKVKAYILKIQIRGWIFAVFLRRKKQDWMNFEMWNVHFKCWSKNIPTFLADLILSRCNDPPHPKEAVGVKKKKLSFARFDSVFSCCIIVNSSYYT